MQRLQLSQLPQPELWVCSALSVLFALWLGFTHWHKAKWLEDTVCRLDCETQDLKQRVLDLEQQLGNIGLGEVATPMPKELREYGKSPAVQAWDGMTMTTGAIVWFD